MEPTGTKIPFRVWVREILDLDIQPPGMLVTSQDFTDDVDGMSAENPSRTFAVISPSSRSRLPLQLTKAHVPSRGSVLGIRGLPRAVEPPFLVTDLLNARLIFNDEANIELTVRAKELFAKDWHTRVYPVESNQWFGILTRRREDRVHLLAFSDRVAGAVMPGQTLHFTEWSPDDPVGSIRQL